MSAVTSRKYAISLIRLSAFRCLVGDLAQLARVNGEKLAWQPQARVRCRENGLCWAVILWHDSGIILRSGFAIIIGVNSTKFKIVENVSCRADNRGWI
jgi:hypothetical protein